MQYFNPEIITFNPLKHHKNYILDKISDWHQLKEEEIQSILFKIGSNLIDLYIGDLSVQSIFNEVQEQFTINSKLGKDEFTKWLQPKGFKKIRLSDESEWVVRLSDNSEKYVHIHPGKYSKNTIRVRASSLKTVIAIKIQQSLNVQEEKITVQKVNQIRNDFLSLSPIKQLFPNKGISKLLEILS
jgi:hypothetical protein